MRGPVDGPVGQGKAPAHARDHAIGGIPPPAWNGPGQGDEPARVAEEARGLERGVRAQTQGAFLQPEDHRVRVRWKPECAQDLLARPALQRGEAQDAGVGAAGRTAHEGAAQPAIFVEQEHGGHAGHRGASLRTGNRRLV